MSVCVFRTVYFVLSLQMLQAEFSQENAVTAGQYNPLE